MDTNISESQDLRLRALVRAEWEQRWLQENQEAIVHYNRRVAERGLLSDEVGLLLRR
jgi:post-segregation antitoxin (ccd killing protein)